MVLAEVPSDLQVAMQSIIVMGQPDPGDIRTAQQHIDVLGQTDQGVLQTAQQHIDILGAAPGPLRMTGFNVEVLRLAEDILSMIPESDLGASLAQSVGLGYHLSVDATSILAPTTAARQPIFQVLATSVLTLSDEPAHNWYFPTAVSDMTLTTDIYAAHPRPMAADNTLSPSGVAEHNWKFASALTTMTLGSIATTARPWYLSASDTLSLSTDATKGLFFVDAINALTLSHSNEIGQPFHLIASDTMSLGNLANADWYLAEIVSALTMGSIAVGQLPIVVTATSDLSATLSDMAEHNWHVVQADTDLSGINAVLETTQPWYAAAGNALVLLTDEADHNWLFATASTVMSLSTSNYLAQSYLVTAGNSLVLTDLVEHNWHIVAANTALIWAQEGYRGQEYMLLAGSDMVLNQAARPGLRYLSVSDTIDLSQTEDTRRPYHRTLISFLTGPLQWVYDPDLLAYVLQPVPELTQSATVGTNYAAPFANRQYIQFVHSAWTIHDKASGLPLSATSSLVLSDSGIHGPSEFATSQLSLVQAARGDVSKFADTELVLEQTASRVILRVPIGANNALDINSTVAFSITNSRILCDYAPAIGSTTDPDAPLPPKWDQPLISDGHGVTFFFPPENPTTTIHLRGPDFDNTNRLSFQRINRESRGGTLIVYADKIWPKVQHLVFQFSGLQEDEAQNFLTFCKTTLGKAIGLIDWENREWRGVIISPQDPIVRDHRSGLTASVEIEAELADRVWYVASSLTLDDTVVRLATLSTTSVTTLNATHLATVNVLLGITASNTITITSLSNQNTVWVPYGATNLATSDAATSDVVRSRAASNTLSMIVSALGSHVQFPTATSTLGLSDDLDVNYNLQRSGNSTLASSHSASFDAIFDRYANNILATSDAATSGVVRSRAASNTLSMIVSALGSHVQFPTATSTLGLSDDLDVNYNLQRSGNSTLASSHSASFDAIFDRYANNILAATSVGDRTTVLSLLASNTLTLSDSGDKISSVHYTADTVLTVNQIADDNRQRYWIKGSSNAWHDASAWAFYSNGPGGADIPTLNDNVHFDSNGLGTCLIDDDANARSWNMHAGFTGTVDVNTASKTITVGDSTTQLGLIMDDGTLEMGTMSTWNVYGDWDVADGTIVRDTSTLVMYGTGTMYSSASQYHYNIRIDTNAVTTVPSGSLLTTRGAVEVFGTITGDGELQTNVGGPGEGVTALTGTIDVATLTVCITVSTTGLTAMVAAQYDSAQVNLCSDMVGAEFNFASSNTTFAGNANLRAVGVSDTVHFKNSTNNPSLIFQGNVSQTGAGTVTWTPGAGTISCTGIADQQIDFGGLSIEDIFVNKSAGKVSLAGSLATQGLTVNDGDFDAITYNITTDGNVDCSGDVLNMGTGNTWEIDGNFDCSNSTSGSRGTAVVKMTGTGRTIETYPRSISNLWVPDGATISSIGAGAYVQDGIATIDGTLTLVTTLLVDGSCKLRINTDGKIDGAGGNIQCNNNHTGGGIDVFDGVLNCQYLYVNYPDLAGTAVFVGGIYDLTLVQIRSTTGGNKFVFQSGETYVFKGTGLKLYCPTADDLIIDNTAGATIIMQDSHIDVNETSTGTVIWVEE